MKIFGNFETLCDIIRKLKWNKSFAIACEVDDQGEGDGWWNIAKLYIADGASLLFNYYGGGYPTVYSIDEMDDIETIEHAVESFLDSTVGFNGSKESYLIECDEEDLNEKENEK